MKLRIKGDSVRLRLTRSEVELISALEAVEATCRFGPRHGQALRYRLVPSHEAEHMEARFEAGTVTVVLPAQLARGWATNEEVGFESVQPLDGEASLRLLVEKDFKCLTPRVDENESDHYPPPPRGAGRLLRSALVVNHRGQVGSFPLDSSRAGKGAGGGDEQQQRRQVAQRADAGRGRGAAGSGEAAAARRRAGGGRLDGAARAAQARGYPQRAGAGPDQSGGRLRLPGLRLARSRRPNQGGVL